MNKYQKKAVGVKKQQDVPQYIWNSRMAKYYQDIDQTNLELGDQGQTFPQFLKMEKRPPNQHGTGRYKFSYIEKIQIVFIPKKGLSQPNQQTKKTICNYLQTYLRINSFSENQIKMQVSKGGIIDVKTQVQYKINRLKGMADAHDVLSVLLQYQKKKTILVAFFQQQLHQYGTQIDGRAYGNGVAVVYYSRKNLQTEIVGYLQTLVHQTLHTLGFDHCLAWKCLMNGYTNFQSWLCPACSLKLYHQLKIDSCSGAIEWINKLLILYDNLKDRKTVRKGKKIKEFMIESYQK